LTPVFLRSALLNNGPLIAAFKGSLPIFSHSVVVHGIDENNNVQIADPWPGSRQRNYALSEFNAKLDFNEGEDILLGFKRILP
jgi:predicted double-glycine peptidase